MRHNRAITLIVAALCAAVAFADNITPDAARQIAKQFAGRHQRATRTLTQEEPVLVYTSNGAVDATTRTADAAYYVFNTGAAGYVVVAGDDRMTELLGYSDGGTFPEDGNIPSNVKSMLTVYAKEYEALQHDTGTKFYDEFPTRAGDYKSSVKPLLNGIVWNQEEPYNNKCPLDGKNRSETGCEATAMAQIMKYHNYPERGTGKEAYTTATRGFNVSCDFGSLTFDWDNMLPAYIKGNYNETQADAVATLMFACGASLHMDYTYDYGSGANSENAVAALRDNFAYDKGISYQLRYWYTSAEWMSMVKRELSDGRPILYAGSSSDSGHAFVFDGYDTNDYIHINWGWGGVYDGYFKISSLQPEGVGIGGGDGANCGFNIYQDMVIGIQKPTDATAATPIVIDLEYLEPNVTSVATGSKFDVVGYELTNFSADFSGKMSLLLTGISGDTTIIATYQTTESFAQYDSYDTFQKFNSVAIPRDMADGTYTLCLGFKREGDAAWTLAKTPRYGTGRVTVNISQGQATFSNYYGNFDARITQYSFSSDLQVGADNRISMTIDNNTHNDIYTFLYLGLIPDNESQEATAFYFGGLQLHEDETTKSLNFDMTLPDDIAPGSYKVIPLALWSGTYIEIGDAKSVEIKAADTATGIEESAAEPSALIIYPQPIVETLTMRTPEDAQSADIYDISGRHVVSQPLTGGRTHSVGVGSLPAGTYIINVICSGKVYKEKFVKR